MEVRAMEYLFADVIEAIETENMNNMCSIAEKEEEIKETIDGHTLWVHHMLDVGVTKTPTLKSLAHVHKMKVENEDDHFPAIRNILETNSNVLKFLFGVGRNAEDHRREQVACYGDINVSLAELQCLKPTFSIIHKVIDIFSAYLYEEDSTSWFLPSNFREQACSNHDRLNSPALVASVISLCGLQKFHRRLKLCSEIFIPLHDQIEDHWYLLVVKLDRKYAEIWDNIPNTILLDRIFKKPKLAILLLQTIFRNEMTMTNDVYYDFPSFQLMVPHSNPTCANKFDNGIYTIRHMQYYGQKWFEEFNSSWQRTMLALEIVNHPKNELHISGGIGFVGQDKRNKSKSTKQSTSETDHVVDCDDDVLNDYDMPPTGRKCRSHRKRRSA